MIGQPQLVFAHSIDERPSGDVEVACGFGLIASEFRKGSDQEISFNLGETHATVWQIMRESLYQFLPMLKNVACDILLGEFEIGGEQEQSFNCILELSDVSGPLVMRKSLVNRWRDWTCGSVVAPGQPVS